MEFVPLWETEERDPYKILSIAILVMWLLTFIVNGIAMSMYYGAQEYVDKFYIRSLLKAQADIFMLQSISGILWFIITVYIFISTLFLERKEKFNILSGLMFFISGIAELVLSIYLLGLRDKMLYYVRKLPIIPIDEFADRIYAISEEASRIAFLSSVVMGLSIGGAFIFLGLSVRKFANAILMKLGALTWELQAGPVISLPSYFESVIFPTVREGAKKMKSGGNIYIVSGILDFLSIIIPSLGVLAFILFIIGMMMIASGRKMINQAAKQFALIPKAEESSESFRMEVIGDEFE